MFPRKLLVGGLLLLLSVDLAVQSQVIALSGGTSTLMHTSGMQTNYRWNNYAGFLGIGYADGVRFGGFIGTRLKGLELGAGDTQQTFFVDSDLLGGGSPGFYARGAQLSRSGENTAWRIFAGESSVQSYYTFYRSYTGDRPTVVGTYAWKINDKLRFHFSNIIQSKFTSLGSIRFQPTKEWTIGAAAGIGNNAPYGALATDLVRQKYRFTAGYYVFGDEFRRFQVINNAIAERKGLNLRFIFRPLRYWSIYASHEALASVEDTSQAVLQKVGLNTVGASGSLHGFQLSGNITDSSSGKLWTKTGNLSVSHQAFNRFLSVTAMATELANQNGKNRFLIFTGQENFSPRVSLRETFTRGDNQNTLSAGGSIRTNRVTIGLEQELIYNTLPTAGRSMYTAWTVNVRLALFRSFKLDVDSNIDQTGRVHYTGFVDGVLFARDNAGFSSDRTDVVNAVFGRYLVKGVVHDESGKPVWGICIHVDGQTAFSDETGQFYIRFSREATFPVAVHVEESLAPVTYEVVSSPVTATAKTPDLASPVLIVVRRTEKPVTGGSQK